MDEQIILKLIDNDIHSENGIISIMGKNSDKAKDIPVVQEQLLNLQLAIKENWQIQKVSQNYVFTFIPDKKYIYFLGNKKIVLFNRYCQQKSKYAYYYSIEKFPNMIYNQEGIIAFMYNIELLANKEHIFPEWFNLFCWGNKFKIYFPQLLIKYMLTSKVLKTDFTTESLKKAQDYGFDTQSMIDKIS